MVALPKFLLVILINEFMLREMLDSTWSSKLFSLCQ